MTTSFLVKQILNGVQGSPEHDTLILRHFETADARLVFLLIPVRLSHEQDS